MAELFWRCIVWLAVGLLVAPSLGGAFLWLTFNVGKVAGFSFRRCWTVYFTACCCAYLLSMGVQFFWRNDPSGPMVHAAVFVVVTVLAVTVLIRDSSLRELVVAGIAVLVIDVLVLGLFFVIFEAVKIDETPGRQAPPQGPAKLSFVGQGTFPISPLELRTLEITKGSQEKPASPWATFRADIGGHSTR